MKRNIQGTFQVIHNDSLPLDWTPKRKFNPETDSMLSIIREKKDLERAIRKAQGNEELALHLMTQLREVLEVERQMDFCAHNGTPILLCGKGRA